MPGMDREAAGGVDVAADCFQLFPPGTFTFSLLALSLDPLGPFVLRNVELGDGGAESGGGGRLFVRI